jgi:hypothetical protein
MKKILLVFTIILMVSCKPQKQEVKETPQKITDWKVEVKYLDKTVDTIVIRSVNAPFMYIEDHVSILTIGDSFYPAASYVKTTKILN